MKHTKGPWRISKDPTDKGPSLWIRSPVNIVICFVPDNPRGQYKLNARLIAAAPELLEALVYVHGSLEHKYHDVNYDSTGHIIDRPTCPACRIEWAIAKATGDR